MKNQFRKHYFTLLEVMVSMGVFCLLMLALMQFFSASQGVWERTGNRTEMFDSARLAVQMLKQDLASAFYGDETYDMSQYRFFRYYTDSNITHLIFAADRQNGLTEVDYRWDQSAQTLSLIERNESDASITIGNDNWVTRPSASAQWITDLTGIATTSSHEILGNVLFFSVQSSRVMGPHTYSTPLAAPNDTDDRRPPAMVYVTLAVISQSAFDKIGQLAGLTGNDSAIRSRVNEIFAAIFDNNGVLRTAPNPLETETTTTPLPQRQALYEGTQFFNFLVNIER